MIFTKTRTSPGERGLRSGFGSALLMLIVSASAGALAQQAPPAKTVPKSAPAAVPPPAQATPAPLGPVGVWIDHTGRGVVEIQPCGQGLCGNIVWMQDPNDKKGQPLRDRLNGDAKKRSRLICGLPVLGGHKQMQDGSGDAGWIYDPEQGESFDVELRMRSPDLLQVKGYKGFKFLSETFQWKRAASVPAPPCPPAAPA